MISAFFGLNYLMILLTASFVDIFVEYLGMLIFAKKLIKLWIGHQILPNRYSILVVNLFTNIFKNKQLFRRFFEEMQLYLTIGFAALQLFGLRIEAAPCRPLYY